MTDHTLLSVADTRWPIARCQCGWTSPPSSSQSVAELRWGIHQAERRAAEWVVTSMRTQLAFGRRSSALGRRQEELQARRHELSAQRTRMRTALERARRVPFSRRDARDAATRLSEARRAKSCSLSDLWVAYFGVGGNATVSELEEMLDGRKLMSATDNEMLSVALDECTTITREPDAVVAPS